MCTKDPIDPAANPKNGNLAPLHGRLSLFLNHSEMSNITVILPLIKCIQTVVIRTGTLGPKLLTEFVDSGSQFRLDTTY